MFGLLGPGQRPLEATVIFEYLLPASTEADVLGWINAWHALGALPFPSEEYNAALQAITDRFTRRGADARPAQRQRPSAAPHQRDRPAARRHLGAARVHLRRRGHAGARHRQADARTGRRSIARQLLASFVNANEESILLERHDIPLTIRDGGMTGRS